MAGGAGRDVEVFVRGELQLVRGKLSPLRGTARFLWGRPDAGMKNIGSSFVTVVTFVFEKYHPGKNDRAKILYDSG